MTHKEFYALVKEVFANSAVAIPAEAVELVDKFYEKAGGNKPAITENGKMILNVLAKAAAPMTGKEISETIGDPEISARKVNGCILSMRGKEYVVKVGDETPSKYAITDVGKAMLQ